MDGQHVAKAAPRSRRMQLDCARWPRPSTAAEDEGGAIKHLLEYSRCVSMRQKIRRTCLAERFCRTADDACNSWQQSVTVPGKSRLSYTKCTYHAAVSDSLILYRSFTSRSPCVCGSIVPTPHRSHLVNLHIGTVHSTVTQSSFTHTQQNAHKTHPQVIMYVHVSMHTSPLDSAPLLHAAAREHIYMLSTDSQPRDTNCVCVLVPGRRHSTAGAARPSCTATHPYAAAECRPPLPQHIHMPRHVLSGGATQ